MSPLSINTTYTSPSCGDFVNVFLTIRGPRRSCFTSKALELCRDVNNEKKTRLDNTQCAGAWWRKFATLSISISDVLNPFSPNFPPNFWIFEFQVDVSFFHCLHRGIIRALLTRSTIGGDLLLAVGSLLNHMLKWKTHVVRFVFIRRPFMCHLHGNTTFFLTSASSALLKVAEKYLLRSEQKRITPLHSILQRYLVEWSFFSELR